VPTTLVTKTTSAVSTVATATAALYGQCGGSTWTGPTVCASGVCKATNTYYSEFTLGRCVRSWRKLLIFNVQVNVCPREPSNGWLPST